MNQENPVDSLPSPALYRLKQVLQRIPVSRSTWFAGINTGRFPRGHHLSPGITVWHSDDIHKLIHTVCPRQNA